MATVRHLPRMFSHQEPTLFQLNLINRTCSGARPFLFQRVWLAHLDFMSFVGNKWNVINGFSNGVKRLARDLSNWNREVFSNIFRKKKSLLARIAGIQRTLDFEFKP